MKQTDVIDILRSHRETLCREYGVKRLALFGSVARDEATDTSDVDMLVEFTKPTGLFGLYTLQDHLEEILGVSVDIGTPKSLKPRLLSRALAESIDV